MAFVKVERPPKSNQILVVGLILGAVALLIMLILAGAFIYRKCRAADLEAVDEEPFWKSVPGLRRYSFKELESITDGFSEQMGKGGFGVVYAGVLKDGTKVAVKRLESLTQGTKEFQAEVTILGGLHHNNLVGLIGFCAEGPHRILVYEYMANGSLDQYLSARKKLPLEWKQRFNIALGAARGLAYLHGECKDTILHLDIKPENILLDENFLAKVSDFGLSTLMGRNETHVITTMRGTPGYLAPEWLAEGFEVSAKCDVFSFGKVLMELFSGRRNLIPSLQETEKLYFPSWLYHITQQGKGVDFCHIAKVETPEEERQASLLMNTAFLCVLENPAQRPSMERVVHMLEGRIPELEKLELSNLFQGLEFALKMPLPGLAHSGIEEAVAPLYRTLSLEFGSSSRSGGMSSVMSSSYISAR